MATCDICGTEWRGNRGECCREVIAALREENARIEGEHRRIYEAESAQIAAPLHIKIANLEGSLE